MFAIPTLFTKITGGILKLLYKILIVYFKYILPFLIFISFVLYLLGLFINVSIKTSVAICLLLLSIFLGLYVIHGQKFIDFLRNLLPNKQKEN